MIFDVEILNLIFYCAQQLGIALGLGAQTIMLVAYVSAMRDGVVDEREAQFLRASRRTLWVAFAFIIVSGIGITLLHILGGQGSVVVTPAYLFKTLLIVLVIALTALLHTLPETLAEGLLGGAWYALFLVHILAPVTSWVNLLTLFVVWLVGFNLVWYAIIFTSRERGPVKNKAEVKFAPKIVSVPVMPIEIPAEVKPDTAPLPQIIIAKPAITLQPSTLPPSIPVEKSPASIMTDTPFLPQVPPLQPIPIMPQVPVAGATTPVSAAAATGAPVPAQPTVTPEVKLGLHVMPKSPDQIQ